MSMTLKYNAPALHVPPLLQFAAAALIVAAAAWNLSSGHSGQNFHSPQTVSVIPHPVSYRMSGEFQLDGMPVDGQLQTVATRGSIEVMKYQVTEDQYGQCVSDGACDGLDRAPQAGGIKPVTGVSFLDAERYSAWLSRRTGDVWRLPTDQEWAALAGSKYADDAIGPGQDTAGPARRWLDQYQAESDNAALPDPADHVPGFFGSNEYGLLDLSGNVWEWTSTCYTRSTLTADGTIASAIDNCGVRIVEGRHRAYMTSFIRDAKTGGCAFGAPPDLLGFRLIREEPGFLPRQWLLSLFRA